MEDVKNANDETTKKLSKRKEALEAIIKEYNSLESSIDKQSYLNMVTEWYMREKTLLLNTKTGDTTSNKYNSSAPYAR